jgi:hypothetical protein
MFVEELLGALWRAKIRYCLVGGVAVNLHGIPRMTYDVDLVAALDRPTLESLEATLRLLGLAPRVPLKLADLADASLRADLLEERNLMAMTFTDPANPLREVDVLVSPPVAAAGLVDRALRLDVGGTPVWIASLQDMIDLKRASGRKQDEDDARLLEALRAK